MGTFTFLFDVSAEYNRVARHNYNFVCTQSIRLAIIFISFFLWGILLYVWVKDIFAQLQFYILTIWLFAISSLAWASGREIYEAKMVVKIREEKLSEGEINNE